MFRLQKETIELSASAVYRNPGPAEVGDVGRLGPAENS